MITAVSDSPSSFRPLLPKEHGLWCWVGTPLLGALLLAPGVGTALGVLAALAWFGAGNAARRGVRGPAVHAAAVGRGAAGLAGWLLPDPGPALGVLGLLVGLGAPVAWGTTGLAGRALRHATLLELGAIGGFAAFGAALAVSGGAPAADAGLLAAVLVAWQVVGLWWVRGQLARVLPGRTPWAQGPVVAGLCSLGALAAGLAVGAPIVGLLPLGYTLRVLSTRPVKAAKDARRVGLGEAAWTAGACVLAALLLGVT